MVIRILIILSFFIVFLGLLYWAIESGIKQARKDWETVDYLKKKSQEVKTKEEIKEFHTEFAEKASKIHNCQATSDLSKIDGYLRGLYKNL